MMMLRNMLQIATWMLKYPKLGVLRKNLCFTRYMMFALSTEIYNSLVTFSLCNISEYDIGSIQTDSVCKTFFTQAIQCQTLP